MTRAAQVLVMVRAPDGTRSSRRSVNSGRARVRADEIIEAVHAHEPGEAEAATD